ncbi:MAG TPA: SDR family oxidoreductase [Streptosporangiaceae bacterium]|nr:SDR family oxidoreductase [Streptosporangiaceae bacterium]
MSEEPPDVLVVVGAGGMGQAIARRCGSGRQLLLADIDRELLDAAAAALTAQGQSVAVEPVDVTSHEAVRRLAGCAASLGPVRYLAHTAGLSQAQASAEAILKVDLSGAAFAIEEFGKVIAPGGAGLVIASMAARFLARVDSKQRAQLLRTQADDLAGLPFARAGQFANGALAYGFAKLAVTIRVQAACAAWARRGARINSISPGVIATPMGATELESDSAPMIRAMIGQSPAGRTGTPEDVAAAAEFLFSPQASFITGTDLLVDGGVTAALATGDLDLTAS